MEPEEDFDRNVYFGGQVIAPADMTHLVLDDWAGAKRSMMPSDRDKTGFRMPNAPAPSALRSTTPAPAKSRQTE
jgi:hypothetical protein